MASTLASLETSQMVVSTLLTEGQSSFSFATAFSIAGPEMSLIRIDAPSWAKRMHVSSPMPLLKRIVSALFSATTKCKSESPTPPSISDDNNIGLVIQMRSCCTDCWHTVHPVGVFFLRKDQ